ncbi:hypothetical protein MAPG_03523 [Magnaporthiopsis poae ATCC 64411]|uniref:Ribosome biogenesis protein SLX9 n=1 Tax=Magnaporthiopsis poae (strain ATCC 64411 / 73-15) TaxID=644358 RepID=A0A0C4DU86_MAGP6|nr:hypothetical protein MAPG_03523 [Magnaporthiopsis poae ATCC 64411]
MAPTAPKKRTTMRAKLAKAQSFSSSSTSASRAPALPPTPQSHPTSSGPLFPDTKRDRRLIRKSVFMGQIRSKGTATTASSSGVTKRRRPSKKLVANLDSLAAALPALEEGGTAPPPQQPGKVRMRSIRHRPGALKRKEKLVRAETRNIGRSLAFLSGLDGQGAAPAAVTGGDGAGPGTAVAAAAPAPTANRWAALRAHITGTMEQSPAFVAKEQ